MTAEGEGGRPSDPLVRSVWIWRGEGRREGGRGGREGGRETSIHGSPRVFTHMTSGFNILAVFHQLLGKGCVTLLDKLQERPTQRRRCG